MECPNCREGELTYIDDPGDLYNQDILPVYKCNYCNETYLAKDLDLGDDRDDRNKNRETRQDSIN